VREWLTETGGGLEPQALQGGADLVIGDRTMTASSRRWLTMPQRFGNWLATTLMALG
jgi:hypothetical protein